MKKTIFALVAGALVGTVVGAYGKQAGKWVATKYAEAKEKYGKKDTDGFDPTE